MVPVHFFCVHSCERCRCRVGRRRPVEAGERGTPSEAGCVSPDGVLRRRESNSPQESPLGLSKTPISETACAKSGAPNAQNTPPDPDLAELVPAWPQLPPAARLAVLAIARDAAGH